MRDRAFFVKIANGKDREFNQNWITRNIVSQGVCMALAIAFITRQARKLEKRPDVLTWKGLGQGAQAEAAALLKLLDADHFTTVVDAKQAKPGALGSNARHHMVGVLQEAFAGDIGRRNGGLPDISFKAKCAGILQQVENLTALEFVGYSDSASAVGANGAFWYVSDQHLPHAWAVTADCKNGKFKLFDPNNGRITFKSAEELVAKANEYKEPGAQFLRFEYN